MYARRRTYIYTHWCAYMSTPIVTQISNFKCVWAHKHIRTTAPPHTHTHTQANQYTHDHAFPSTNVHTNTNMLLYNLEKNARDTIHNYDTRTYMHIYIYVCTRRRKHTLMNVHRHTHNNTNTQPHMCVYTRTYIHNDAIPHLHTYTNKPIYTRIRISPRPMPFNIYTYRCVYIRTYMHAQIHTFDCVWDYDHTWSTAIFTHTS